MVSNGNQHDGGGNQHNSGGVRHSGGGVQYISAIDEKNDESKPSTSLHKLTVSSLIADSNQISCCGVQLYFIQSAIVNRGYIFAEGLSITLLVIFYTSVCSIDVTLGAELRRPKYWA
ncbi:hypothetical protein H5410_060374 [Solanum commersonii]|uniref:Uncharacterized protein n=1 Tax=Solanum commersonii TaxID=4109 RepID=A0A9J5W5V0_SOLCO|nr:hypothetical protein H5410_060374 [Solanum commersonii]